MELISGLPDDIARDCLIRVSYDQFPTIVSVCKDWMIEIHLPEFSQLRKAASHAQKVFVMAQASAEPGQNSGVMKCPVHPVHRLTICEPGSGSGGWRELPLAPGWSNGLPMFCQLVGVGSELMVIGGWDPVTWKVSNSVFIYNFLSATWRHGADMPGEARSFFGCASDGDRTVYVAGGHDDEKIALKSAMAYDVEKDEWAVLPDMARERDECKAIFHGGKFHVIGGYCTEMQGRFERSAEVFDVNTGRWDCVQDEFLEVGTCPRTCVEGGDDEAMYMCRGGDVVARKSAAWQTVAKLPDEVCHTAYVVTLKGKLLVIGSAGFGEPHTAYTLDLKSYSWTKLETPEKYSGHVQSGCCLEI